MNDFQKCMDSGNVCICRVYFFQLNITEKNLIFLFENKSFRLSQIKDKNGTKISSKLFYCDVYKKRNFSLFR